MAPQAQPAMEASLTDATSAAWSAAPRWRAGGAAGGRSERDESDGDASMTAHVMQLLVPVDYPSAAAVGSAGVSKICDSFSQLIAAMDSGNAAGYIASLKTAFMDALFSDSEVGSEKMVWCKFGKPDGEKRRRGQQQSADEFLQFLLEHINALGACFAYTEQCQPASLLYVDLAPMADVDLSALIHAQFAGYRLPLTDFKDHLAVVIKRWRKKDGEFVKDSQMISNWETLVIYDQDGNVDTQFELSGFIQHTGQGPDHGHYTCCSKRTHADKIEWLTFDDERISPREETSVAREEASRNCFVLLYVRTRDGTGASAMSADFQKQVEKVQIAIQQQDEGDDWEQASAALIAEAQHDAPHYKRLKESMEQGPSKNAWPLVLEAYERDLSVKHKCSQPTAAKAIKLAMEHGAGADPIGLSGGSAPLSVVPELVMWNDRASWNINPDIPDRKLVYDLVDRLIVQHRIYCDLLRVPMNDSERTIFIQRPEQSGKTYTCILSVWLCNLCYGMAGYVLLRSGSGARADYEKFGGNVESLNRMIWEVMLGWTFEGSGNGRRYKKLPGAKFQLRIYQRDSELTDDTMREAFMQKFELTAFNLHDDKELQTDKAQRVMKYRHPIMFSRLCTASNVWRARSREIQTLITAYGVDEDGFANLALLIDEYQMDTKVGTGVQEEIHQPFKDSEMFKVLASAIEAQHPDQRVDGCAELHKRIKSWEDKGVDRDRFERSSFSAAIRGQQRISATQVSCMTFSDQTDLRHQSIIELAVDEEYWGHETSKGIDPNKEIRPEWRGGSDLELIESDHWSGLLEKLGMHDVPALQKFVLSEVFVELRRDGYAHILLQAMVSNNAKLFDVARFLIGYADETCPEKPTMAVTAYVYTRAGSFPGGPWLICSDAALDLMQQIRDVARDMFIDSDKRRRTPVPEHQIACTDGSQIAEKIKSHEEFANALQFPQGFRVEWILALVDRAVERRQYLKRNIKIITVGGNMFKVGMTVKSFEHRMSVTVGVTSTTERREKNMTMEDIAQGMAGRVAGPRRGDPYFQERGHNEPPRVVFSGNLRDKYIAYKKMQVYTMQCARDRVSRGRDQPLLKAMYDLDYEGFSDLPDEHIIYNSQTAKEKKRVGGVDTWNDSIKHAVKRGKTSGFGAATPSRNAGYYGMMERQNLRRIALDLATTYPDLFKTTDGQPMPTFENKVWKKWRPGSYDYYRGTIINVKVDTSQNEAGELWYTVRFDRDEDNPDGYVEDYQLDPDMHEWYPDAAANEPSP